MERCLRIKKVFEPDSSWTARYDYLFELFKEVHDRLQEPEEEGGDPSFKTVEAPVGAKVDYVPDGAASETIDGVTYFVYNDVYYQPFYSGSEDVYIVAEKPEKQD